MGYDTAELGKLGMTKEEAIIYAEKIGALSTRAEKEVMWELSMQYVPEGGIALEVGTWTGGSAVIIGEVCRQKNARLICIDAFSADMHTSGEGVRVDAFNSVLQNCSGLPVDYMAGESQRFVNYIKPELADFIFIDGLHHLPGVRIDIEGYWQAVKPGGCYLLHDYGNPCDVKQVVDSFFRPDQLNHVDSTVYIIK